MHLQRAFCRCILLILLLNTLALFLFLFPQALSQIIDFDFQLKDLPIDGVSFSTRFFSFCRGRGSKMLITPNKKTCTCVETNPCRCTL